MAFSRIDLDHDTTRSSEQKTTKMIEINKITRKSAPSCALDHYFHFLFVISPAFFMRIYSYRNQK